MSPVEGLARLARRELERASSREAADARTGGLGHVVRLLSLLHHTLAEFDEATAAFLANIEQQEAVEAAYGSPSKELFTEGGRLSVVVHLRADTFYALARHLLDSAARAMERYFGRVESAPLATHDQLQGHLAAFAEQKGLREPPSLLLHRAELLTTTFLTQRDFHVGFGRDSAWTASVWQVSGDASISPVNRGAYDDSVTLHELLDLVEDYVQEIVYYLEANRDAG